MSLNIGGTKISPALVGVALAIAIILVVAIAAISPGSVLFGGPGRQITTSYLNAAVSVGDEWDYSGRVYYYTNCFYTQCDQVWRTNMALQVEWICIAGDCATTHRNEVVHAYSTKTDSKGYFSYKFEAPESFTPPLDLLSGRDTRVNALGTYQIVFNEPPESGCEADCLSTTVRFSIIEDELAKCGLFSGSSNKCEIVGGVPTKPKDWQEAKLEFIELEAEGGIIGEHQTMSFVIENVGQEGGDSKNIRIADAFLICSAPDNYNWPDFVSRVAGAAYVKPCPEPNMANHLEWVFQQGGGIEGNEQVRAEGAYVVDDRVDVALYRYEISGRSGWYLDEVRTLSIDAEAPQPKTVVEGIDDGDDETEAVVCLGDADECNESAVGGNGTDGPDETSCASGIDVGGSCYSEDMVYGGLILTILLTVAIGFYLVKSPRQQSIVKIR